MSNRPFGPRILVNREICILALADAALAESAAASTLLKRGDSVQCAGLFIGQ
jgi:hypothetical protein